MVSIIIITYNKLDLTKCCLRSIKLNTIIECEIIVVDNNSKDGTQDYIKEKLVDYCSNCKYIFNSENLGFAPAVNQGISIATGDYICLLNNDVIVKKNWISNMIKILKANEDVAIVGPMSQGTFYPQYIEDEKQLPHNIKYSNILYGFCMVFEKKLIEKIGLFDETFKIGNFEDHDFNERAIKIGKKLLIDGNTFVEHVCHASWESKIKLDYYTLKNKKKFMTKWGFLKKNKEQEKYRYFECEKSVIVILSSEKNINLQMIKKIEEDEECDEYVIVDKYEQKDIQDKVEQVKKRIIYVKYPVLYPWTNEQLIDIGICNCFGKYIFIMRENYEKNHNKAILWYQY